ncbi:MAG: glycosyltransferase family 8 protein [Parcubacteria group bacterium]
MEDISILLASDDNYAQHLGVVLCSIFENRKGIYVINIYIIDGGLSRESKLKLEELEYRYNFKIKYLDAQKEIFKNYPKLSHWGDIIYNKLLIDRLLPNVDKVLYLDCDIVVLGDIRELYDTNIENKVLAAAERSENEFLKERVVIDKKIKNYFNAGVLLFNLKEFRKKKTGKKCLNFIEENAQEVDYPEQDALNYVIGDDFVELAHRYNFLVANPMKKSFKRPFIIHYNSKIKPWHQININPYNKYYIKYLSLSPWKKNAKKYRFRGRLRKYIDKLFNLFS